MNSHLAYRKKYHENCSKEIYLSGYFMKTTKYSNKIKKLPQDLKAPLFRTILNNTFRIFRGRQVLKLT